MGKEIIARIFRERDWSEEDGVLLLEERRVSDDWSWMSNRWIVVEDGVRTDFELSHRLYSARELKSLFTDVGFREVTTYGDFEGSEYDHTAQRLVVVARK
jgi:hypothetical protein